MRSRFLLAILAFASISLSARADTFRFSFGSSSDAFSGSGLLTTGTLQAPGEYAINSISGSVETAPNGTAILIASLLSPGTFPTPSNGGSFPANDNVLFAFGDIGNLDSSGLSFILSNGAQINLYNPGNLTSNDALLKRSNGVIVTENVPVSITALAATPEPSSFALIGTGLLGIAGLTRRRLG